MVNFVKSIGRKGELVIPKSIRKYAGLDSDTKVRIVITEAGVLIIPLKKSFRDFAGLFGKGGPSKKELDDMYYEFMAEM